VPEILLDFELNLDNQKLPYYFLSRREFCFQVASASSYLAQVLSLKKLNTKIHFQHTWFCGMFTSTNFSHFESDAWAWSEKLIICFVRNWRQIAAAEGAGQFC